MIEEKYVLISPCRNEANYMEATLDSVVSQSVLPSLWLIVDDGSTDNTSIILQKYKDNYDFIQVVQRQDRGHRSVGPGVIEAFYTGYSKIQHLDFQFLCKLDLDLKLPSNYFEILIKKMKDNPRLGTCSGKPFYVNLETGKLISEKCGDENSVGMTKFYRRTCFEQIGGFVRQVMWDGIDGHRCRMYGWIAESYSDTELRFIHLRPMGSSQKNWLTGRVRHGFGQYFMGTGFVYMTASAMFRMTRSPILLGGMSMLWGYVLSALQRRTRYEDPEFRKFLRAYQRTCLIYGKKKATDVFNNQSLNKWSP